MRRLKRFRKWYGVKILFLETKRNQHTAFRIETLVKENSPQRALRKAVRLWKHASHPHGRVPNAKWEYVGPIHVYECFTPPVAGGMLGCFKDFGKTWQDALRFVAPESKFELSMFEWKRKPSSENLCRVKLVYFVRPRLESKFGKVTTCECIVKATNRHQAIENAYRLAVQEKTKKMVIKIRRDGKPSSIAEFAGIDDIIPIYRKVEDGMELDRTVQRYKSRRAVHRLLTRLNSYTRSALAKH
ncbi:MAG: hypothetical protein A3G87_07300 [Omnitrophica bacterium RIFCSPLOWO2_12_FULL_50_11]|nr:MAG: hypothetical protein A3G87_07300 [Omnitrophica bacterium RIFCSPLOWO2_12_FULL_50_11]